MTVVVGNIIHLTSSIIHPTGRGSRWSLISKKFRSATLGDACQSKNNNQRAAPLKTSSIFLLTSYIYYVYTYILPRKI